MSFLLFAIENGHKRAFSPGHRPGVLGTPGHPELRVRPPGIEWKTGRNPKMGKNWAKKENGPRPEMGEKWPKNGEEIEKLPQFPFFRHFWAIFFPTSGRWPFSIFWPIFSHFWISARFPFYTRRPDSQLQRVFRNFM